MGHYQRKGIISQLIFGWLAILIATGCSQRPKEILSEKEMIDLMADLQLADAYSNSRASTSEDMGGGRYGLARSVMAKHGVTPEKLDTTLGWYGKNLDEYVDLYAKIEKELNKRRRKLMKNADQPDNSTNSFDLWPYSKNGLISPLSTSDGWILSINNPELGKGERLVWSMRLAEKVDIAGNLGVEYSDGSGETAIINRLKNNHLEISLQTDSSKTVSRIYGSLRITNSSSLPIYSDSIKLEKLPFDSLEYRNARSQKRYAASRHSEKRIEKTDSTEKRSKSDSIPSLSRETGPKPEIEEVPANEVIPKSEVPRKVPVRKEKPIENSKIRNGKN